MSQNTSSAVMQQRHEALDSLDDFPTPPWAARALCECLASMTEGYNPSMSCWEPACNRGYMVRGLSGYFERVYSSDVHPYGFGAVRDFLFPGDEPRFDWIITNPPFVLGEEFALTAVERARYGVAMFTRLAFLEGQGRFARLFSKRPPTSILQFTERPILHRGLVRDPSLPYWDEEAQKMRRPSTATAVDDLRDIDPTLRNWAAFWIGMGWQVSRIDGGYSAVTPAPGGSYFIRQCWAEIDPAACAEQLAVVLDRWPWLVEVPAGPRHIGEVARDIVRRLGDER